MSMHILIHIVNPEACKRASTYIYKKLNALFPNMARSYANGELIIVGNGIVYIDFRSGAGVSNVVDRYSNFYYTDSDDAEVLNTLRKLVRKFGKRLNNVDQVVDIIGFYMEMIAKIDECLKESEE